MDQVIAWGWTGDKPLSEPAPTQFTDAYMSQLLEGLSGRVYVYDELIACDGTLFH